MNCPKCSSLTKVVLTKAVFDKYINENTYSAKGNEVVRRRYCKKCNHRFYTHGIRYKLKPENLLEDKQICYVGSVPYNNQKIKNLTKNNKIKVKI